jgi:hypothetical protein
MFGSNGSWSSQGKLLELNPAALLPDEASPEESVSS